MNKRLYLSAVFILTGLIYSTVSAGNVLTANKQMKKEMPGLEDKTQSRFGVLEFLHWNHPWNNYKYPSEESLVKAVTLMKEAGVGWVRMDFLWQDIEPEKGKFVFDRYDKIVDLLSRYNIKILGLLNYSTDWAASDGKWNSPPEDNSLFVNYASLVISRYKDKVKYWEVWNEPDSAVYWVRQDGLKSYCVLLKEVYIAAKRIDPDCAVLNGGLANGIASVNKLYDNGAQEYFDILNIHIFESPLSPGALARVKAYARLTRKVMSRNKDTDKKVWITEIGCPGIKKGLSAKNWWLGDNPDEEQQARWLEEVFKALLKDNAAEKVFWAFFRDCRGHWDNGIDYFGLVRWDFSRKPSFFTYQTSSRTE
ncbi:MAG: family 1 glycosylhydrolase [Candidatus Omnitrophota bacterium]